MKICDVGSGKERSKKFETLNTDDHVSAWGARPAYQQDLSEPQNEGGRLGDPARAGEPGGATGTIVKTSPG